MSPPTVGVRVCSLIGDFYLGGLVLLLSFFMAIGLVSESGCLEPAFGVSRAEWKTNNMFENLFICKLVSCFLGSLGAGGPLLFRPSGRVP